MKTEKLTKKKIEQYVNSLYRQHAYGIQFDIFDLGKVMAAPEEVLKNGGNILEAEQAIKEAISKYRVN